MTATLMDSIPASRAFASAAASSRFEACLRRFETAGFRLMLTAPTDTRTFARGIEQFAEREIDPAAHARWETAYRLFCGRGREACDRGSWRILAVDRDDRVAGAITARFFCGKFVSEYLHLHTLLETTGPVFREHCEMAVADVAAAARNGRMPAEVSGWAVTPGRSAPLVAVTLLRAMAALTTAFAAPLVMLAADNRRGEVAWLMRRGASGLGVRGRFVLPPFVYHATGAWLRLLLVDGPAFFARMGALPEVDLTTLRERARCVSAA